MVRGRDALSDDWIADVYGQSALGPAMIEVIDCEERSREKQREYFAKLQPIIKLARPWFYDAVHGAGHREINEPRFHVPSETALYPFAQMIVIVRERRRQERLGSDPISAGVATHLRASIRGLQRMATRERKVAALKGLKTTGKQYQIEQSVEELEIILRICRPCSVNPIHLLASAAQRAWECDLRWDAKELTWELPNVPRSKNAEGPLAQVIASALAFIGEGEERSPATVEAVLKGKRR